MDLRSVLPGLAAAALIAASCGATGGGDLPTTLSSEADLVVGELIAASAEQTQTAGSYRFEMGLSMAVGAAGTADTGVLASGELVGETAAVRTDMDAFIDTMGELDPATPVEGLDTASLRALAGRDLDIEIVTDGSTQFFRGGFFGALADIDPFIAPFVRDLETVADGWGHVEVGELSGVDPADLTSVAGPTTFAAPTEMLAALGGADVEMQVVGDDVIRGVAVTRYAGSVALSTLGGMTGQDPSAAIDEMAALGFTDDGMTELLEQMITVLEGLRVPVVVWIDEDGFTRRTEFTLSTAGMARAMAEVFGGDAGLATGADLVMTVWIEMFDFDDPSVTVAVPPRSDSVDLTETFVELAAVGGF